MKHFYSLFRYTFTYILFILLAKHTAAQNTVNAWSTGGPAVFPVDQVGQINGIGRISQIKFDPIDTNTIYAVSPHAVFKTTTHTANWAILPGSDNLPTGLGVASICIDRTNTRVLYLGTGDANYYSSGAGVWKSVDGGYTFVQSNTGMGSPLVIDIIMSPTNANVLVAATNAGIFKSSNAGNTWALTSVVDQFTDIKINTANGSRTLYAVTASSGIFYTSTDFGSTWTSQTISGAVGAGRIATFPQNSSIIYLAYMGTNGATNSTGGMIYKSSNGGQTFTQKKGDVQPNLFGYTSTSNGQGNYNMGFTADPSDTTVLYTCGHIIWKSTNSGTSWTQVQTNWATEMHTDQHQLVFNPNNGNQLYCANDGGVWLNTDKVTSKTWKPYCTGLVTSEFYTMADSKLDKTIISGGLQDNGEVYSRAGIWYCNRGGDFTSKLYFDFANAGNVYYNQNGNRRDLINSPAGAQPALGVPGSPSNNDLYAFSTQNTSMAVYSQNNTSTPSYNLYYTQNLQAATPTWTQYSNFSSTKKVSAIGISPANTTDLYVLFNDRSMQRTANASLSSTTFSALTTPSVPSSNINNGNFAIFPNGNVYVSLNGYVYRSTNKGIAWSLVGSGPTTSILQKQYIIRLLADMQHTSYESIYAETAQGIYYKDTNLNDWIFYSSNLPTTSTLTDLDVFYDTTVTGRGILRASTYGRAVWESNLLSTTPTMPPSISITSPAYNTGYASGGTVNVNLTASASSALTSGSINNVQYYIGDSLIGIATTSPYNYTLAISNVGSYSIIAKATDNNGSVGVSDPISVVIRACNAPVFIAQSLLNAYAASSEQLTVDTTGRRTNAIDGNTATFWHTQYTPSTSPLPHYISISLGKIYTINTLKYLPRQNNNNGYIGQYQVYTSIDSLSWGAPIATGTFTNDATEKVVAFPDVQAKYIKLVALSNLQGNQFVSAAEINIGGCNLTPSPTVSILTPTNNAGYPSGSTNVTLTSSASSAVSGGTISKVEYYNGPTLLGSATSAPYSFTWNTNTPGKYTITAKATDNSGGVGTTTTTVVIRPCSTAPVFIAQSSMNAYYASSEELAAENGSKSNVLDGNTTTYWHTRWANGMDSLPHYICISLGGLYNINTFKYLPRQSNSNGYIGKYQVYASTDSLSWGNPLATGTFANDTSEKVISFPDIQAKYVKFVALSNLQGNQFVSAAEINVGGCTNTPVSSIQVAILTPAGNTGYPGGIANNITFTSSASTPTPGASIVKVEYYNNGILLGNSTSAPYSFTWNNVSKPGTYSITAKAIDNYGGSSISQPIQIVVRPCSSAPLFIPQGLMKAYQADSQELTGDNGSMSNVLDGNSSTFWHTQWYYKVDSLPHYICLSLGGIYTINTFKYLPRQNNSNGYIGNYQLYASTDSLSWGAPIATGTFANDATEKTISFPDVQGKYIKLVALSNPQGNQFVAAAELNVGGCNVTKLGAVKNITGLSKLNIPSTGKDINILVFPNPTHNEFRIKIDGENNAPAIVNIYNVSGALVVKGIQVTIGSVGYFGKGFAPGIYFIEVIQGTKRTTSKVVKE